AVGEGPQRRAIHDFSGVLEGARGRLPHEGVEAVEEGRQRLARAGRRGEEHVLPARDDGPSFRLDGSGLDEAAREPRLYDGMEHATSIVRPGNAGSGASGFPRLAGKPAHERFAAFVGGGETLRAELVEGDVVGHAETGQG